MDDTDTDAARNAYLLEAELASWLRDVRQLIGLGVLKHGKALRCTNAVTSAPDARGAAIRLRQEPGVGHKPLGPLIQVSERAGQLLLVAGSPGAGASVIDGDLAVCVVSPLSDPGRRRSTAAHALGHFVIGDEYSTDLGVHSSREDRERAVNALAAEFLLPTAAVLEIAGSSSTENVRSALIRLAAVHRASWSMVLRQAEQAKVIDQRHSFASRVPTRAELMDAAGRVPEPDLEQVRVPPSVATAVMEAWRRGFITPGRAAELTRGRIGADDLVSAADDGEAP